MKKIILLLGLLLVFANASFAQCDYECVSPYNMNNKFRAVMSNVVGANALTEKKLESILRKEVLKIASADDLKINIDSYSPKDLKNGIFKGMKVKGNNVVLNDINFTSFDMETICDFNYIRQSGKEIIFVEAMPLNFDISMDTEAINKTVSNAKYQKIVKDLNRILSSYGLGFQVSSAKMKIKNNKLYYVLGFEVPFITKEYKLVVQTDLSVKDGKIDFSNTHLVSNKMNFRLNKLDFIMNYLNPLDFSVNIFDNKSAKVNVKNVEIKDDMVFAQGVIVVPKD
ncbi:hypothetical protein IKR55_05310 [bacterium]|nr:hypothetical protein [bacterium]